jgi:hypothetical protein
MDPKVCQARFALFLRKYPGRAQKVERRKEPVFQLLDAVGFNAIGFFARN